MNSQRQILALIAVGIIVLVSLSLLPYSFSLISDQSQPGGKPILAALLPSAVVDSAAANKQPAGAANQSTLINSLLPPTFDAAAWYSSRDEPLESHGVLIETYDRHRVLASHNADTPFNPASLTKLATSLVALKKLGPNHRFQTAIFADGSVDAKGTLRGKLRVTGADPTFGDVAANLILKELSARGIKRVTDGLVVSSAFSFNFSLPEEAATRLAKALRLGAVKTEVADERSGTLLFVCSSYPLSDVLLYMNAHSNNFVADRIGDTTGGPQSIQQFLIDELKLPAEQVYIESASGLGRNRMTPRGLVRVMRMLVEEAQRHKLKPEDIVSVASCDRGTLRHRLAGTGLAGAVVAKTGTLTTIDGGMASLAGLVYTKDSGIALFALLDQGSRVSEYRQMEDQLLAEAVGMEGLPCLIAEDGPRKLLPPSNLLIENVTPGEGSGDKFSAHPAELPAVAE